MRGLLVPTFWPKNRMQSVFSKSSRITVPTGTPMLSGRATEVLSQWGNEFPLVLVAGDDEPNVTKTFRNLERAVVVSPGELEVAALVWARAVLVTQDALDRVKERAS